jgi:hypothetical protein
MFWRKSSHSWGWHSQGSFSQALATSHRDAIALILVDLPTLFFTLIDYMARSDAKAIEARQQFVSTTDMSPDAMTAHKAMS